MAEGAEFILLPEIEYDLEDICLRLEKGRRNGKTSEIIVMAEGAGDSAAIVEHIKKETGIDTRLTVLGHMQRGGPPTAFDRILAMRLANKAVELIKEKRFGEMASFKACDVVSVPLKDVLAGRKSVPPELYEMAKTFFR